MRVYIFESLISERSRILYVLFVLPAIGTIISIKHQGQKQSKVLCNKGSAALRVGDFISFVAHPRRRPGTGARLSRSDAVEVKGACCARVV